MIQRINVPISVNLYFDHHKRCVLPTTILWEGKNYPITKIGMHHTLRQGRTLFHIFSVETESLFFRLVLNTDNLFWTVEEIADGESD